jgi:hypothetical protein
MREYEFAFNKVTKEQVLSGLIYFSISKSEVENMDFKRINDAVEVFKDCKDKARGRMMLTFGGYDYTPDEIYEIPEIRNYVAELLKLHPYLFYYISDIDNNNQVILACLCDIQTIRIGQRRQTIKEIFFNNEQRGKVGIQYDLNAELMRNIVEETFKYGKSVGDKEDNIRRMLDKLFDLTPKSTQYEENLFGSIQEAFSETEKRLWVAFVKSLKFEMIPVTEMKRFTAANKNYIMTAINGGWLSVPVMLDKDVSTNVFIVNDKAYGVICERCDSSLALMIKNELETDPGLLNDMVFVPAKEIYISNKISPFDEFYLNQIPIPINPDKDKWYCPTCNTLHDFKYDKDLGLMY